MAATLLSEWMPQVETSQLGGFYLWLDAGSTGRTAAELVAQLRALNIVVSTGEVYSPTSAGFLRIALTAADDELEIALTTVAGVLRS